MVLNRREWLKNFIRYGLLAAISGTAVYLGARTTDKQNESHCSGACSSCGAATGCDQYLNNKKSSKSK